MDTSLQLKCLEVWHGIGAKPCHHEFNHERNCTLMLLWACWATLLRSFRASASPQCIDVGETDPESLGKWPAGLAYVAPSTVSAAAAISGFRIIRKLGEGRRAEVFLARTERDGQSEHGHSNAPAAPEFTRGTLALKLYRGGTPQHDWLTETEALERAAGAHVVGLFDIAAAGAGRTALVLERLEGGSLEGLLRQRAHLSVGEAITIVAPIVETVARMHAAGVAHGAVSARSVLFSCLGAPVLARFGSAVLVEPEMPRARRSADPSLIRDVSAIAEFAASVLRSVQVDRGVLAVLAWLAQNGPDGTPDVLTGLTAKLYDLGVPAPVQFLEEGDLDPGSTSREAVWQSADGGQSIRLERTPSLGPLSGRRIIPSLGLERAREHELTGLTAEETQGGRIGTQATAAFLLPTWLSGQLDRWLADGTPLARAREAIALRVPTELTDRIAAARASLSLVRPRVWLIVAVVVVALVTAISVEPHRAGDNTATETAIDGGIGPVMDAGDAGAGERAEISEPLVTRHPAIMADDPVAAASALAAAREQCVRDRSVLCLDGVAQAGSAALSDDQNLVRALQGGAELTASWSLNADSITVVERLGNSVLLRVAGQNDAVTTILMMKGNDGWRFRDYLT